MKREGTSHSTSQRPRAQNGGIGTFRPTTAGESWCELLILADGTVLAQNLTEKMAGILSGVAPHDSSLQHRVFRTKKNFNHKERQEHKSEGTDANGG